MTSWLRLSRIGDAPWEVTNRAQVDHNYHNHNQRPGGRVHGDWDFFLSFFF